MIVFEIEKCLHYNGIKVYLTPQITIIWGKDTFGLYLGWLFWGLVFEWWKDLEIKT